MIGEFRSVTAPESRPYPENSFASNRCKSSLSGWIFDKNGRLHVNSSALSAAIAKAAKICELTRHDATYRRKTWYQMKTKSAD